MKSRSAKKTLGPTVERAVAKARKNTGTNPVWNVPVGEAAVAMPEIQEYIPTIDPGKAYGVFETTAEFDQYGHDDHPAEVQAIVRDEFTKCPYLWPQKPAKFKKRSDAILEPIRAALRAQGLMRVIWRGSLSPRENELPRENMIRLFGDRLVDLERELGQLLLAAVCTGNDDFTDTLAAALKDADELFHRGKSLDAFFKWKHTLAPGVFDSMKIGEVKEAFISYLGRDELSGTQWKRIKEEFDFQSTARGKPGPRPKKRRRK